MMIRILAATGFAHLEPCTVDSFDGQFYWQRPWKVPQCYRHGISDYELPVYFSLTLDDSILYIVWDGGTLEKPDAASFFVSCKRGYLETGTKLRSNDPNLLSLDCSVLYSPR